jgi:hypothetical protein
MKSQLVIVAVSSILGIMSDAALSEDVVVVRGGKRQQPNIEKRGTITDYTGEGVTLLIGDRKTLLPADQIVEIRSSWTKAELAGDAAHAAGDLPSALAAYRLAKEEETRPWGVRKIQVKLSACYEWNDQNEMAGEEILSILEQDDQSPYFYALPLAWQNAIPNAVLTDKAKRWMADRKFPAARLLGASWLLGSEDRTAALNTLLQLGSDLDPRIAPLALAQQWRTKVVTATSDDIALWRQLLDRMSPEVRGGPLLVLGNAFARHKDSRQASLCLLQTALLAPQRETLAAQGFLSAAKELEQQNQFDAAARLYRELQTTNPLAARMHQVAEKLAAVEKLRAARP